jgi:hypothetical protein
MVWSKVVAQTATFAGSRVIATEKAVPMTRDAASLAARATNETNPFTRSKH